MPRKGFSGFNDYDDGFDDDEYDYDYDYDYHYDAEENGTAVSEKETRKSGVWSCKICTYDNDSNLFACDICGVLQNPSVQTYNEEKKTVEGLCKDYSVSKMAKSLFASMPHQIPRSSVLYKQLNYGSVTEEKTENLHLGNVEGEFYELRKTLSSHKTPLIRIEPFKFDSPSPDDLVSNGLRSSKIGSKGGLTKILKVKEDGLDEQSLSKNGGGSSQAISKTSKSSSLSVSRGKHDPLEDNSYPKHGAKDIRPREDMPQDIADSLNITNSLAHRTDGPQSLIGDTKRMSLTDRTGNISAAKFGKQKIGKKYKPEQWILSDKEPDTLSQLNLAIVGHVDSGKSTLSGRLLHLLGRISQKQMHKYEREAKLQGKGSFAYAWALDESVEERERGITMTVAVAYFDTKKHHIVVLDSPGHKDFVPNMIAGATQADAAILVIDASVGAFEAGLDNAKGQTREHARVLRGFGVEQIIVAVNKMDAVKYSKDRFDLIKQQLGSFLHSCRFKDSSITWIPLSAMENQNLVAPPTDSRLLSWYKGPFLVDAIDSLKSPTRDLSKPLLMPICDIIKTVGQGQVAACGKLEAGALRVGFKVLVVPWGDTATVRSLERDSQACTIAKAGDNVSVTLQGIDANQVMAGDVLCHPDFPVPVATHLELTVLVMEGANPILIGSQLEFHVHHAKEAATVVRIVSLLDPKTGEPMKKSPRCLMAKQSAVLEVVLQTPVCVETFIESRALGRVFLRSTGKTVAMGKVTRIIQDE